MNFAQEKAQELLQVGVTGGITMKVLLETQCNICGERRFISPEELIHEDVNQRIGILYCSTCANDLAASDQLRALGGLLSAVSNNRKHVSIALHAARMLMTGLEKKYPWKLKISVIAQKPTRTRRRSATISIGNERIIHI